MIESNKLDIVLEYLRAAIKRVQPDPKRTQQYLDSMAKLRAGEITWEEHIAGQPPPPTLDEVNAHFRLWSEVVLFAETFYFVAWRLTEVLNRRGPLAFPRIRLIQAHGVRDVRNQLIEHPERTSGMFQRSVSIAGDGPVLKATSAERIDQGLFINAQELHDKLGDSLRAALPA